MKMNEYQNKALETRGWPKEFDLIYPTLGLVGEAGEFADKVKKTIRGDYTVGERRVEMALELGDVLWYLSACAYDLGYTLEEVAEMNNRKLADRRKRNVIRGDGDNR